MGYKIVSDSSSNVLTLGEIDYASVPLKIITAQKEYTDADGLDVAGMIEDLASYKGKTTTSCPNVAEWLDAFGDGNDVFAVTITSKLSGSFAAASEAKREYEKRHPDAKVCVIDTLSAGPGMELVVEKLKELALEGKTFEQTVEEIEKYQKTLHLAVSLQSLMNLARNGRTSIAVAKLAGVLGIRIVGAAIHGELKPLHKCRGEKKALETVLFDMKENGYNGGRVRIAHCLNLESAQELKQSLLTTYPNADISVCECKGLCSFYAEKGGLIIGYEG